jgi:FkbM family methyltransferase
MPELNATPEDVKAAYRLVLGREPDPVGFSDYIGSLTKKPVSKQRLLTMFLNSQEYLARQAGTKVDIGGGVFVYVDPAEPEFGRAIVKDATWEPHIVKAIQATLARGQVFVDVGANVGVMAFTAAQAVGPQGKVIAFEPNEDNARYFLRGVFENGYQEFVRLYRVALSDKPSLFALRGSSNTHLIDPAAQTRLVQGIAGDDVLASEPAVDLIKLDIESHEPFALRGLARTIRRHKPKILCEFNPRGLKDNRGVPPEDFAEQIFDLTREVQVIEHNGAMHEVNRARDLMNLWARKNHEAVRAGLLPNAMVHFDLLFRAAL